MSGFSINEYEFNDIGKTAVGKERMGKDWPVVYLIHNDEELYIGEMNAKMDKTEKKYPIEKAKGVSTKYNKL